jgi:SARP family transcriptional regulator, regulator of embCAB operon
MSVEIKVLGPMEVSADGVPIPHTASKPSQLLALLALNAGNVVTVAAMVEEIWGDRPPRSGVSTLRTYILTLRQKLEHAPAEANGMTAKNVLVTRRAGYLLDVPRASVDALRYEQLSRAGRAIVERGDHETASRILGEALRLWRGPALADLPAGPQLSIEAMRLAENRLGDLHLRIEADLRLGRHHQLLGELATLCARHPLQENFCTQHMIALYRSGRQSEALEVFRRLRTSMVDQLGVEPSARAQREYQNILSGRTVVDAPAEHRARRAAAQPSSSWFRPA